MDKRISTMTMHILYQYSYLHVNKISDRFSELVSGACVQYIAHIVCNKVKILNYCMGLIRYL